MEEGVVKIKQIEWEEKEFAGEGMWRSSLPFGYFCSVRRRNGTYRYSFMQRALTVERGQYSTLKRCQERCQEIWEELVMEALEENS